MSMSTNISSITEVLDKFLNREVVLYFANTEFDELSGTLLGYTTTNYGTISYIIIRTVDDKNVPHTRIITADAVMEIKGGELK